MAITAAALCVAAASLVFVVLNARAERNAALVSIGISILRADPDKEKQVSPAREWALDLIDANAGGVKFSEAAREALLVYKLSYYGTMTDFQPYSDWYQKEELRKWLRRPLSPTPDK